MISSKATLSYNGLPSLQISVTYFAKGSNWGSNSTHFFPGDFKAWTSNHYARSEIFLSCDIGHLASKFLMCSKNWSSHWSVVRTVALCSKTRRIYPSQTWRWREDRSYSTFNEESEARFEQLLHRKLPFLKIMKTCSLRERQRQRRTDSNIKQEWDSLTILPSCSNSTDS